MRIILCSIIVITSFFSGYSQIKNSSQLYATMLDTVLQLTEYYNAELPIVVFNYTAINEASLKRSKPDLKVRSYMNLQNDDQKLFNKKLACIQSVPISLIDNKIVLVFIEYPVVFKSRKRKKPDLSSKHIYNGFFKYNCSTNNYELIDFIVGPICVKR